MVSMKWTVDDGYVGNSRPQSTKISAAWFDEGASDDELVNAITAAVQDDFEQKVCPTWTDDELNRVIAELRKEMAASSK